MPDLLLLDVAALLDHSKVGQDAAKSLEKAWAEAKQEPEDKRRKVFAELQQRRDGLRGKLLARARPFIEAEAKKRGAKAVIEKGTIHWSDPSVDDITSAVIAGVDQGGPLA